ncbi:MAG: ABC transporter ATP-binding protein [Phycisphaerales bacterium]|nr:MAG: ABC transporter ATP-binding protein [Phycisphaerales bacterium]
MRILQADSIRKEFGTLVAVNNVDLSLEKGQVVGLIGPNGAGKTTLLRTLGTLLRPTSGSARLLGYDLTTEYLDIRKHVGFLPDFFNLYGDLTLRECLQFFAEAYDVQTSLIPKRVDEVLQYIELQDQRDNFIRHLSRGMVQRVGVGILLAHDPELFLLDEPASGLDPKARIQLRNVLKKLSSEGKTIIISSHILTELSGLCSHIAIMDKGSIELFGAVDEIQRKIVGSGKVDISVLSDCEEAVALVRRFPAAEVIAVDQGTITVEMADGPRERAKLNTYLVKEGVEVVSFAERKADLEDLFMRVSGRRE